MYKKVRQSVSVQQTTVASWYKLYLGQGKFI